MNLNCNTNIYLITAFFKFVTYKLSFFIAFVLEKDFLAAKQLADESLSDAKLATAKASSARARKSAQEMRNTVQSMKQEIERTLKH